MDSEHKMMSIISAMISVCFVVLVLSIKSCDEKINTLRSSCVSRGLSDSVCGRIIR